MTKSFLSTCSQREKGQKEKNTHFSIRLRLWEPGGDPVEADWGCPQSDMNPERPSESERTHSALSLGGIYTSVLKGFLRHTQQTPLMMGFSTKSVCRILAGQSSLSVQKSGQIPVELGIRHAAGQATILANIHQGAQSHPAPLHIQLPHLSTPLQLLYRSRLRSLITSKFHPPLLLLLLSFTQQRRHGLSEWHHLSLQSQRKRLSGPRPSRTFDRLDGAGHGEEIQEGVQELEQL